ncbi:hypothetical protein [Peribacillus kribbensis]|uniref:hypothetical protein n=1 Tax=Peribacillus kribbensis TaxID=356658 RepID=UPI00047D0C71|nr:hypothetical protein [Peribacillus kribbensis]
MRGIVPGLIKEDARIVELPSSAEVLDLPDWLYAGFIRSKGWDALYQYIVKTPLPGNWNDMEL